MKIKPFLILGLAAGLASLAQSAKASIVYTDFNSYQVSNPVGVVYAAAGGPFIDFNGMTEGFLGIDPNGNGIGFVNYSSYEDPMFGPTTQLATLYANPNLIARTSSTLASGSTVDGSSSFEVNWNYLYPSDSADEQYIGAAAKSGSDTHYGWVGFTLIDGVFTLKEAAFNSTANEAITIQTVPEPSALILGALGATGLLARRRRAGV
ncbi:MAG: PEP-CTERM sorting domain-containing protein [Verrucomicrobiota bacterium]